MHDSLTIALLQAREAAMTYFRPIVKSHNLTDQHGALCESWPIAPLWIFTSWPFVPAFCVQV